MVTYTGHCYCGGVRVEWAFGESDEKGWCCYCHCDSCRRSHAAPLYHVAILRKEQFRIAHGEELVKAFRGNTVEGAKNITRHFCETCGSKIFNSFANWDKVGTFPALLDAKFQTNGWPEEFQPKSHHLSKEHVIPLEQFKDGLPRN